MSRFSKAAATSRIGIGLLEIICGRARQIWREQSVSDIGLDGNVELVDADGTATGVLFGVQVRTGSSYVNPTRDTLFLNADRDHFEYWFRCQMPVIGVAVDPTDLTACWIDLTEHCTPNRIATGPYNVPIARSDRSTLTAEALVDIICPLVRNYVRDEARCWRLPDQNTTRPVTAPPLATAASSPTSAQRLAWNQLCGDFTSSKDVSAVASAGHRLSWHLPSIPSELVANLDVALRRMTDFDLARALGGAALAFRADRTDVSELIANLLDRIPEVRSRILRLVETDALPDEDRECAVQILELWAERPLPELWSHVPRT